MHLRTAVVATLLVAATASLAAQPGQGGHRDPTQPDAAALAAASVAELASLLVAGDAAFDAARQQIGDVTLDQATRAQAAWLLAESGDADDCDTLAATALPAPASTSDADPDGAPVDRTFELALAAARGRCGDPVALLAMLDDADPLVQLKAATTLGILDVRGAADPAFALLDDPDLAEHQAFVVVALAMMQEPAALELMPPLLRSRAARPFAAIALGRSGEASVTFDLRFLTEQSDPILRHVAAQVLVAMAAPGTDDILRRLSDDPSPRVAAWAAREARRWGRARTLSPD